MVCFICNLIFAGFIKFEGYQVPAIILSGILALALAYYLVSSSRWMLFITRAQQIQHLKDEVRCYLLHLFRKATLLRPTVRQLRELQSCPVAWTA